VIEFSPEIQKKLLSLSESGMGYQIVEATYSDYSSEEYLVMNAAIAEPTNNRSVQDILKSIYLKEANRVYKSASKDIIDVRLEANKGIFKASVAKLGEAKGADNATEGQTNKNERFTRFSYFEDDKRIDKVNKKVFPGTYATTFEDALYCINNRIDPVARYALPSAFIVEYTLYTFDIRPLEKTPIKRGTAEPANDQPGDGIEVLFTEGTDSNTVSLPPQKL